MGRSANAAQQARARARQRMVELARERIERERRIEDAVTAVYLAAEKHAAAEALVQDAEHEMAAALRTVMDEGSGVEQVATLCDLSPTYIRQLTRRKANGKRQTPDRESPV